MGAILSNLLQWMWFGQLERRILMLGLDGAGKTTILYKLKLGERIQAVPTIGFNVEEIQFRTLHMTVWDVGGQNKIRALWKHYYTGTDALIYVVDASDTARLAEAGSELHRLMQDDALGDEVPVLVFANKQDLPNASSVKDIGERLGLGREDRFRWYVQPCSATHNEGLLEGLHWLAKEVTTTTAAHAPPRNHADDTSTSDRSSTW